MTTTKSNGQTSTHSHRWGCAIFSFGMGFFTFAILLVALYLIAPMFQVNEGIEERAKVPVATLKEDITSSFKKATDAKNAATRALVERMYARQQEDPNVTMDFLVLSGGGANGAFGAGFLLGWETVPPGQFELPKFDGVTGVSTGSFIAPFAYIGTNESMTQIDDFFRNPKPDWAMFRHPIYVHPENASLMDIPGIERDLESIINVDFAKKINDATTDGRILLIQTGNIDQQIPGVFDFTKESQKAEEIKDASRMQEIILASSAIPAIFPPREIDGTLYVDGGAIGNFYTGGRGSAKHDTFGQLWKKHHPDAPIPLTRYWVILNGNLRIPPEISEPTWPEIFNRSFQLLYTSAEITALRFLYARAELTQARGDGKVEVRWIALDTPLPAPDPTNMFNQAAMQSLSDYGKKIGANPKSWNDTAP